MKGTTLRQALAVLFFLFTPALSRAQSPFEGPAIPDSSRHFGLVFDIQLGPHFSSPSSYADGGYTVSLGFGLNFSPLIQMAIHIYTGRESIPPGSVKPVNGWLPVGGASLEATVFLTSVSIVRPYGTLGYGLYTIAGGEGYNGGGPHFEAGVAWEIARYFSLRAGAQYTIIRFHDPTGEAYQSAGFEPFTARLLGGAIRATFYPSVLP
jgi:hypothetical protein